MPRAFISHAPADRPFVEGVVVPLLASQGVQSCYSRDDVPAAAEEASAGPGVRGCDYVVVVMSPRSAQSRWVRRQTAVALSEGGKPILQVVVEDCDAAAFPAGLAGLPRVDFCNDPAACERFLAFFRALTPPPTTTTSFTNALGMKFALVPRGAFWMGGGGGRPGARRVEMPRDFYLGVSPVTQEQWLDVMGNNPSYFSRTGGGKDAVNDVSFAELKLFPVECVSWDDAQEFLGKVNA
jgi:formylglycine-generating enzyme required for sulfatase activity